MSANLTVKMTVAVFPNENYTMLLGNDFMGGPNAKLQIVAMCSTHSAYFLCDKMGNTGVVHYIKNIEGAAFPAAPQVNKV